MMKEVQMMARATTALKTRRTTTLSPVRWFLASLSARRQLRRLAALDDHLLADVGITRDQAEAEAALPLWDVPRHWYR
jgi:uncharacterized protein YjiS (DUF1127 family)